MFTIRVPASTANLGPGFDALGAALSIYLTVSVEPNKANCFIITAKDPLIPTDPDKNLITRVAVFVANCHNESIPGLNINIDNNIPLGLDIFNDRRGMGSSGSAVVAGISLANEVIFYFTKGFNFKIDSAADGGLCNIYRRSSR
jgi:homoserine kinase